MRLAAAMGALLFACGDNIGPGPCAYCDDPTGSEACWRGPDLMTCVSSCGGPAGCRRGHPCVLYEGRQVCSPFCTDELCGAPDAAVPYRECSRALGECREVVCGRRRPCDDAAEFCDLSRNECYPRDGRCKGGDCPRLDERVATWGAVACIEGRCHLASAPPGEIAGAGVPVGVNLSSPRPGDGFPDEKALVIEWTTTGTSVIVLVLSGAPSTIDAIRRHAVWGAVVPLGGRNRVTWAEGYAIREDGVWDDRPGSAAPRSGDLFVLVQAVKRGKLIAVSQLVPFRVGGAFARAGETRCLDEGALPGSCWHPVVLQRCTDGLCRALCASDANCEALLGVGRRCLDPRPDGVRHCD